jgi:hypothetical protein
MHSPIHLHGVVLIQLITGTTLALPYAEIGGMLCDIIDLTLSNLGGGNSTMLLDGSQASHARQSDKGGMNVKTLQWLEAVA